MKVGEEELEVCSKLGTGDLQAGAGAVAGAREESGIGTSYEEAQVAVAGIILVAR